MCLNLWIYFTSERESLISFTHKTCKDGADCNSYRPISQNDYRYLTSILAKREGTAIKHIIHPDQTGFIAGCQFTNKMRRFGI